MESILFCTRLFGMDIIMRLEMESGFPLEDEYTSENHTDLFLEKISKTNIKYEALENEEGTFIIYGYK